MAFDPDSYLNQESGSTGSFDPDSYLGIQKPKSSIGQIAKLVPTMAGLAVEDVAKRTAPAIPPILGGMVAGPGGAAAGAGLTAIGQRMAGIAKGTEAPSPMSDPNATLFPSSPTTMAKEAVSPSIQALVSGIAQEPKLLNDIPGVPQTKQMLSNLADKFGKGMARAGETLSGAKKDILKQAYDQGLSTYGAPSLPKAQAIFGEALGPEGQGAMKQSAGEAFDPALGKARQLATDIGTKIEQGQEVSAIEALKARQATDRIISATPVTDKISRNALYGWRNQFDNELAGQSGELADASRTYRKAIVKDQLLSPTRLNKSGEPSAFLPMLVGHGMIGKGIEGGLGMLTATSPAMWGVGATTAGQIAKGLNVIGDNPAIRQSLLQILNAIRGNAGGNQGQ